MKKYYIITCLIVILTLIISSVAYATDYTKVIVNGNEIVTSVPPQVVNNVVVLPVRDIAESLGATVSIGVNNEIIIDRPQEPIYFEQEVLQKYLIAYNTDLEAIQLPLFDTSVSQELYEYLISAFDLLKAKTPETYKIVCAYIPLIKEVDLNDIDILAQTDMYTTEITFNTGALSYWYKQPKQIAVKQIAIALAHESYHVRQSITGSQDVSSDIQEAEAYAYTYGVAKQLGADKDVLDWLKSMAIDFIQ